MTEEPIDYVERQSRFAELDKARKLDHDLWMGRWSGSGDFVERKASWEAAHKERLRLEATFNVQANA